MKKNLLFSVLITCVCSLSSVVFQAGAMTPGTQGIFISAVENDTVCAGDAIAIDFNCSGLTPTGSLSVELSDASGSFASPVIIATVAGSVSGTINATVPGNTPMGSGYRVRITSSAPVFTGSPNGINIRVNPLPVPAISADGNGNFCEGECITLNAGPGYACYLWGDGSTAQTSQICGSGTYQVTVCNANGCSASTPPLDLTFNPNPEPVITPDGPTAFCDLDSVMLNTGNWYVSYQWFVNGTELPEVFSTLPVYGDDGDCYSVHVADANGCMGISDTVCITVYPLPEPVITADGPPELCYGDTIVLSVDGEFDCYLWTSGSTTPTIYVTESGPYQIYICDSNGCMASTPPLDIVFHNPEPTVSVNGSTLTCNESFASYQWYYNGAIIVVNGQSQTYTNATGCGNYTVTVMDEYGCMATSDTVYCPTSIDEPVANTLGIFPNPASDHITIRLSDAGVLLPAETRLKIVSAFGQVVYQSLLGTNEQVINTSAFSSGLYSVFLETDSGKRGVAKFVIE